jgi:hypothetical protein
MATSRHEYESLIYGDKTSAELVIGELPSWSSYSAVIKFCAQAGKSKRRDKVSTMTFVKRQTSWVDDLKDEDFL